MMVTACPTVSSASTINTLAGTPSRKANMFSMETGSAGNSLVLRPNYRYCSNRPILEATAHKTDHTEEVSLQELEEVLHLGNVEVVDRGDE